MTLLRCRAPVVFQHAHVTSFHTRKEWVTQQTVVSSPEQVTSNTKKILNEGRLMYRRITKVKRSKRTHRRLLSLTIRRLWRRVLL